nr:reverse transcriptase domain-containing protein [Tanacetum cinerariifolium]
MDDEPMWAADRVVALTSGFAITILETANEFAIRGNHLTVVKEEDFDGLLDKGSKILHSIKGTLLEEEIFEELNEFMAMTANENSEYEFDTKEPPFKKIAINTDYKIKTSLEEPHTDLELKPLPNNLEYVFLEEPYFLHVIISSKISTQNKSKLVSVLKKHKEAFAWKTTYILVEKNDIIWLMASMGSSPCLNTRKVRPESSWGNSELLKMDWLSIVETDKVIHTVETDIAKLLVEIKSFGMTSDKFDEEAGLSNRLQPKQADLSYVHALNKLHLHRIYVVLSKHEVDQY